MTRFSSTRSNNNSYYIASSKNNKGDKNATTVTLKLATELFLN